MGRIGHTRQALFKRALQEPALVLQPAEQPPAVSLFGFHAVVIAAGRFAAPPARFDPFRAEAAGHAMPPALVMKHRGRTVQRDADHVDRLRGIEQPQRPQQRSGQRRRWQRRPAGAWRLLRPRADTGKPTRPAIPPAIRPEPRARVPSGCSTVRPAMPTATGWSRGASPNNSPCRCSRGAVVNARTRISSTASGNETRASCSLASASKCCGATVGRNKLISIFSGRRFRQTNWHVKRKTPCPCSSNRRDSWLSNSPKTCSIASWCVVGCSKHQRTDNGSRAWCATMGSAIVPASLSRRSIKGSPKRAAKLARGKRLNCPIRRMPSRCSCSVGRGGSRNASTGR